MGLEQTSLIAQTNSEIEPVLTIMGIHAIKAVWRSPTHLEIESTGLSDVKNVVTQKESWRTVNISYGNTPP
jgi:hypothetical protein